MSSLLLSRLPRNRPLRLLCLGAHSDDIEIGAGATVLQLLARPADVTWVVFSALDQRAVEAESAARKLLRSAKSADVKLLAFRDGFFPSQWEEIKESFEDLKRVADPDLIFTHYRDDRHQDHRVISDLTWNAFRRHFILEYEIPKYDGDLGRPNVFVPVTPAQLRRKIDILQSAFATQRGKHWFDEETFRSLARLRGLESATRYAEAFHARKLTLEFAR